MIPLFDIEKIYFIKNNTTLLFKCEFCSQQFRAKPTYVKSILKREINGCRFCSKTCSSKFLAKGKVITTNCTNCNILLQRRVVEKNRSKSGNCFCSQSCSAKYNNTHKTSGTRRSKLEVWLEEQLTSIYPDLKILFNNKETINSELDIYIPSLKLAIELNGIFHYEPIYGKDKLSSIHNNDNRKFQACLEQNIELLIIDVSNQKYFKESTSIKFIDIIKNVIETKLICGTDTIRTYNISRHVTKEIG